MSVSYKAEWNCLISPYKKCKTAQKGSRKNSIPDTVLALDLLLHSIHHFAQIDVIYMNIVNVNLRFFKAEVASLAAIR